MTTRLDQWLERIERLHPREIDMGLERVSTVAERLGLIPCKVTTVTVAGTNGKGSCVAAIAGMLQAAGYLTGTYTSPHLLKYNERICIDAIPVDDDALVSAFEQVDQCRAGISLTYFEFGTLAALLLFARAGVDVMVLETGMGGRLDAVNIIDANLAVITGIALDHQEWLGDTREKIALEKAGILRPGIPVVCADPDPPHTLFEAAVASACPVHLVGRDFGWSLDADSEQCWKWQGRDIHGNPYSVSGLPSSPLLPVNLSAAIQAVMLLPLPVSSTAIRAAMGTLSLPGRQQKVHARGRDWLLDVSHNPHAAMALAQRIKREKTHGGRMFLVLAMLRDKDHHGYVTHLESVVDFWYIAQVHAERALGADRLLQAVTTAGVPRQRVHGPFDTVSEACAQACSDAEDGDTIAVCGSFYTVSHAMQWLDIELPHDTLLKRPTA